MQDAIKEEDKPLDDNYVIGIEKALRRVKRAHSGYVKSGRLPWDEFRDRTMCVEGFGDLVLPWTLEQQGTTQTLCECLLCVRAHWGAAMRVYVCRGLRCIRTAVDTGAARYDSDSV